MQTSPAIGIIELNTIARGFTVTDAMSKKAPVRILRSQTVHPGKFLIIIDGGVAEVDESMQEGLEISRQDLVDQLFLPQAHNEIPLAIERMVLQEMNGSLGIFETTTVASTVLAADAAVKTANVHLVDMVLADDLGGKAYYIINGPLEDVEVAMATSTKLIPGEKRVREELIANPHRESTRHWLDTLKKQRLHRGL